MNKLRLSKTWLVLALAALLLSTSAAIQAAPAVQRGARPQATELPPQSKIEQQLQTAVTSGEQVGVFITFADKPDLSRAYKMGWEERGKFVYETLKQTADESQARVRAFLDARQIPYQAFIIDNSIYIRTGDSPLLDNLAAFSEVGLLRQERFYAVPDVKIETAPVGILAAEWGVTKIGADGVWAKGYTGQGIVVASIDTGVRYTHNALVGKYRGNLGGGNYNHTYSWSDPTGTYPSAPGDNNGHGSHTMGTMVGDDGAGNQIGVAPGAKWIACKGCSASSCADSTLNACADWMLAPGGDTSMRPNVVNNSWGGCTYDNWYRTKVEAWRAAGIYPVFAAGNTSNCGYSSAFCGSIGTPATYKEVTAVGSTTSSDGISNFSLWGPSQDPTDLNEIKPEVSAPGSSIRSAYNTSDTSYTTKSGTSMAAPHVSGALALIWSACPSLKGNFDATEQLLKDSAQKIAYATACGNEGAGNIPNNAFGYGRIDVLAAVNSCSSTGPTPTPTKTNTPTPTKTNTPTPTKTNTPTPTKTNTPTPTKTNTPTPTKTKTPTPTTTPTPASCPGTAHKWQSDYYGQTPYQSLVQPDPPVCLSDDRCLYSTGDAANHGTISGTWICSWDILEGRSQGAWYQCEETRANAHKVIEGYECQSVGVNYVWIPVR
jgi:subtilisin family serine protease